MAVIERITVCSLSRCLWNEAYIAARADMKATDRQRLIAETKSLLQDIVQSGELNPAGSSTAAADPAASKTPSSPNQSKSKKP